MFYALMILAVGVGLTVAFLVDGFVGATVTAPPAPVAQPITPFNTRTLNDNELFLQVTYQDTHNRQQPTTVNGMNEIQWGQSIYNGAGGVIGHMGTFWIHPLQGTILESIQVRYHTIRPHVGTQFNWNTATVLAVPQIRITPPSGEEARTQLEINFDRVGTYRVTIEWQRHDGQLFFVHYQLAIINARIGHEVHVTLNRTPFEININHDHQEFTLNISTPEGMATLAGINPRFHYEQHPVTMFELDGNNPVGVDRLTDFFEITSIQHNQLTLTRRENVLLPAGTSFRFSARIVTYQETIYPNGVLRAINHDFTRVVDIHFRYPPLTGQEIQWWILWVGILVLGLLGFGVYASNWMIAYSGERNTAKREHKIAERTYKELENIVLMQEQLDAQREPDFDDILSWEDLEMLTEACETMVNIPDKADS